MSNPGSCLCGNVTWTIAAEPLHAFNCHCKMCRKAHGAAFGTYWFVASDQFQWTSETQRVVNYSSSPEVTRSFCSRCGSVVPYASTRQPMVIVPAGCHDSGRASDCEIFVAHRAPWYDITSDLPRHSEYPPETGFGHVDDSPATAATDDAVQGSCLCGAVRVRLTEPLGTVQNCHCRRCRHARAAAHASNGFTSMAGVEFLQGHDHLSEYKVADARFFTQTFCNICGSKLPRIDRGRQLAVIPLGCLDDDPGKKPERHIFTANKAGWHDITDGLPQFSGAPG